MGTTRTPALAAITPVPLLPLGSPPRSLWRLCAHPPSPNSAFFPMGLSLQTEAPALFPKQALRDAIVSLVIVGSAGSLPQTPSGDSP